MTALRRDHELLVLGEIFFALNKKLGEDIEEVEREQLITRWFETIDGMCSVEAQSTAGRKVKASAIITFFAQPAIFTNWHCRSRATFWRRHDAKVLARNVDRIGTVLRSDLSF
jgi:hypothetical protein